MQGPANQHIFKYMLSGNRLSFFYIGFQGRLNARIRATRWQVEGYFSAWLAPVNITAHQCE